MATGQFPYLRKYTGRECSRRQGSDANRGEKGEYRTSNGREHVRMKTGLTQSGFMGMDVVLYSSFKGSNSGARFPIEIEERDEAF
ncbi:MAG: hypothetical protein AMXMBFR84_07570 [Candidatus Hydrogenedentota bacterium]